MSVHAQHCILCHTVRRYGADPIHDLLGVTPTLYARPDTEFPWNVRTLQLFVRLTFRSVHRVRFQVELCQSDPWAVIQTLRKRAWTINFPQRYSGVHDFSLKLPTLVLPEVGMFAAVLKCRVRQGRPWQQLGAEYFGVEQRS